jgi:site-specific DNA-methyltransferase (adenine-specific)
MTPRNVVIEGDSVEVLRTFASESVDVVAGSPPYFRLRRYSDNVRELGTERTADTYVTALLAVCREARRVLKPGGSLWLVIGDSYSRDAQMGARPKSLLAVPERVMLALIADGWLLRSKVAWTKTTPLPSPVRDRLTNAWESVLHLTQQPTYTYDLDPIRIPLVSQRRPTRRRPRDTTVQLGQLAGPRAGLSRIAALGRSGHPAGRNPTDHWHLPPGRAIEGHTATFPEALIRRPILATCPERVCVACGSAWQRSSGAVPTRAGVPILRSLVPCGCNADWRPGLVVDPWVGTGTTLKVAREHGRDATGIELVAGFAALARRRAGFDDYIRDAA